MGFSNRICKRELGNTDKLLYEIGLVALGIAFAAVLLYFITGFNVLNIHFTCLFNKITRLPCMGCGGTRAARALVRGEFVKSLYDYPPLIPAVIVFAVFMIRCFLYKHIDFGPKVPKWLIKSKDGAVVKYFYILFCRRKFIISQINN